MLGGAVPLQTSQDEFLVIHLVLDYFQCAKEIK